MSSPSLMLRGAAQRIVRGWFLRLARYQEEFLEAVKGRKFRNPDTGNDVQFGSLDPEEQARLYEQWARSRQIPEAPEAEAPEAEAPEAEAPEAEAPEAEAAPSEPKSGRYGKVEFDVDGDGEGFLREVMGDQHRERLLDSAGLRSIGHLIENVFVEVDKHDKGADVTVRGFGDHGIEFKRILSYERSNGEMRPASIRNDQFMVDQDAPEGIGTRMLATQVRAAEREGFRDIRTTAAGRAGTSWHGYYVWPRLGFDGEIDKDFLEEMPDEVRRDVDELAGDDPPRFIHLMASPTGREWWRDHGRDVDVSFPLGEKEDNLSRGVLFEYAREKAQQMGKDLDEFLSRVGSKKKTEREGDGMRLTMEDEHLLNTAWRRIRKRLLEKKNSEKPGHR